METHRRNLLGMAAAGVLLILVGTFSSSWISGSGDEGVATEVHVGLNGGTRCVSGQCTKVDPGAFDDNLGYIGMVGVLGGLAAIGVTLVAGFWISRRQEIRIDPTKLAIPVGAGAACAAGFLFVGHQSAHLTPGWSAIAALLGYGASAGSMFLAKQWLPNAPYVPGAPVGSWNQQPPPQWNAMPPGGHAPPAGGYAPPRGPVQPVQQIQPTMPGQPQGYGAPGGYAPPSQPPMMPGPAQPYGAPMAGGPPGYGSYPPAAGGQPSPPLTPQPFVPQRPASSSQPPVAMMSNTIPPGSNPCPKCATGLAYSSQYGKWYCARCREYM